jgi:hypothetical protein
MEKGEFMRNISIISKVISICIVVCATLAFSSAALATTVTLAPDMPNAAPGSTVNVSIDMSVSSPITMAAISTIIYYDPTVFTYEDTSVVVKGGLLTSNWDLLGGGPGPGELRVGGILWDSPFYDDIAAGSGTLFTFTLKVNEDAPAGLSSLTWGVYNGYDNATAGFDYGDKDFADVILQGSDTIGTSINIVPEPATIGLLTIGGLMLRRKK